MSARQYVFEQIAEQLHRHVLQRQDGTVRQFLDVESRFQTSHGRNLVGSKDLRRKGPFADRLQVSAWNTVYVEQEDFEGEIGDKTSHATYLASRGTSLVRKIRRLRSG